MSTLAPSPRAQALDESFREGLEAACGVIDAHSEYDRQLCCDGRECGCYGSTVHQSMQHYIRLLSSQPVAEQPWYLTNPGYDPFAAGFEARQAGVDEDDNPFTEDTSKAKDWSEGWESADNEADQAASHAVADGVDSIEVIPSSGCVFADMGVDRPVADGCRYRALEDGEIIKATDEYLEDDAVTWTLLNRDWSVGGKYNRIFKPMRRPSQPRRRWRDENCNSPPHFQASLWNRRREHHALRSR
ncbi:hypothetical protein [Brucella rhizosphaerae]|nr:hypothetical protein [Brucella rhizosphaerae]